MVYNLKDVKSKLIIFIYILIGFCWIFGFVNFYFEYGICVIYFKV